ncbi:MAG: SRPBCC domain-containing protein [Pseudomonadota bacterium]
MNELGAMTADGRLEFVRVFRTTADRLWSYLVEDEHRRKWICGGDVEPRVGGKIVFDFDHSRLSSTPPPASHADEGCVSFDGEVLAYDRPRHLAFSWPEAEPGKSTRVSITLKPVAEGTELHLIHENIDVESQKLSIAAGWHTHLDLLGDLLDGRATRDFWVRHTETEALYSSELASA